MAVRQIGKRSGPRRNGSFRSRQPPLFIVERNGDVSNCSSVQKAECAVESVDVEDGEYTAVYDAVGRLLDLHVETPRSDADRGCSLGSRPSR